MTKRGSLSTLFALTLVLCGLAVSAVRAQTTTQVGSDVVLVLPFENNSTQREYNWIGASFADSLTDILSVPGLAAVSGDERELIYQRLRLPLTTVPSRATAIKLAREAKATLVVLGSYNVTPAPSDKSLAEIRGTVRVVRVNEGRLAGKAMPDGRWGWQPFDFGGPVTSLQKMQGTLAYQILYQRDDSLPFSLNKILEQATRVPPRAFESYVKGVMTDDPGKRSAYLQNALKEYARQNTGAIYPEAAFEMGNLFFKQEDYKRAAEYYSKLQKKEPHYGEAAFNAALSYWRLHDLQSALAAMLPLTSDMPLTGVYNNAGALAAQAARAEKQADKRQELLQQSLTFLGRAKDSAPEDEVVRFNYAYALLLAGKLPEATEQLRAVLTLKPRDGEALFLYAKTLERAGAPAEAATAADNDARRYLPTYAKLQTEWQKSQTTNNVALRLSQQFDVAESVRAQAPTVELGAVDTQDLLAKAREYYQAGRDDEVMIEINRVLRVEPMNAEAHLLIGRIYQRRGDLVRAISSLKTAIFWDAKLIDAHILLGRIFLERDDRAQAIVHARTALQLDPNNQEALALNRQVETGAR